MRIKLWLGKMFGWDKGGIRALLFLIALPVVALSAEYVINKALPDPPCTFICNDEDSRRLDRDFEAEATKIVQDILRDSR